MRHPQLSAEDRLTRLLGQQALLHRVSREIGPALELEPVLHVVLEAMRSLLSIRGGSICLVDEAGVYVAAADEPISPEVAAMRIPVGTGLAGRVVSAGTPVYSPDIHSDERTDPALRTLAPNQPTRSYLAVPLYCLGQVTGLLQVDSTEVDAFTTDDVDVLEALATQVAGAIESARRAEAVRQLEQAKADFLARVSHELRTPLTLITGFVDTLLVHGDDLEPAQRVDILRRVDGAGERLRGLIDELLAVNQFDAALIVPHPRRVAVRDVLVDVRERSVDPARVTIDSDASVTVATDPRLLAQALSLLVDNALKYGEVADVWSGPVDGRDLVVEVRDRGPGVPPERRAAVFDRFTRGDHTSWGMGLGLPVAASLLRTLGATIEVDDRDGGGAVFRVRLAPTDVR